MMHEHVLGGCTPTPLAHYLKALGILRLVAEQKDFEAAGRWQGEQFVLRTVLSREELNRFFLEEYRLTPIISPWNGRAGFLEGENGENSTRAGAVLVKKFEESKGCRLASYRHVIRKIRDLPAMKALDHARTAAKKGEKTNSEVLKTNLLVSLRANLPDSFIEWMDACQIIADKPFATPVLGTGGNEGSMDFSVNHLDWLSRLFDLESGNPTTLARICLPHALFGEARQLLSGVNPGQLAPASVGGPNMGSGGFAAPVFDNPWNFVLMLEGACTLSASATRRLEDGGSSTLSYPFIVQAVTAGSGGISAKESTRPEVWLPLWAVFMSYGEVRTFFSEGRITLGRKKATDALDFARSIAGLAVDRGIGAFERIGFFERRGQGYYVASSIGRFKVPEKKNPLISIIDDLDRGRWLTSLRSFARKDAPGRILQLTNRLESRLFALSQDPSRQILQEILWLLGDIQKACAVSSKARETIPVLPQLRVEWALEADDGSHEFRLACALAGLASMRNYLVPLKDNGKKTVWAADSPLTVWGGGDLVTNLLRVLDRRLLEAQRNRQEDKPLAGFPAADLAAVIAFLQSKTDDVRIAGLLAGLVNVELPQYLSKREMATDRPPAVFGLMKPLFTLDSVLQKLALLPPDGHLPLPREVVTLLKTGNRGQVNKAIGIAWRRLRIAGLKLPAHPRQPPDMVKVNSARLAAALMVPLAMGDFARICQPFASVQEAD